MKKVLDEAVSRREEVNNNNNNTGACFVSSSDTDGVTGDVAASRHLLDTHGTDPVGAVNRDDKWRRPMTPMRRK